MASTGSKPAPGGLQTRRATCSSTPLLGNSDATYNAALEKINNADRARELLESKELIPSGQPLGLMTIHNGLLHLARSAAPAAITLECLVAFLRVADAVDMDLITSEVANQVCHKTLTAYNILNDGAEKIEQLSIALDGCMNRAVEQVRDLEVFQKNIQGEFERGMKELVDASKKALGELQVSIPTTGVAARPSSDGSGGITEADRELLTYTAAARRNVPAVHTRVVAQGDARCCQVLIDRDPKAAGDGIHNLSERELVVKASIALDNMGEDGADAPDGGIVFRSARRLKNGGVIFEINTVAAADWLRKPDVMHHFISFYDGGNSVAKGYRYPIIVKFVSTNFDLTSQHKIQWIETDTVLPMRAIQVTQWLKPVNCHRPFQAVADTTVYTPMLMPDS
ncbi:hypothetical protein IEO21_09754 [Rhodonia placenta]|uniref:Uncharacterized protein n=1 Tax=Rhodonia placenta TaxID=104341 RepID=A0A8H7TY63_9APHY|nr:hypothetical protein IEO21_09754 [Postia placenta]